MEQLTVEKCHVLSIEIYRSTIVPQVTVNMPQVVLRHDRETDISQGSGNRQSALARRKGAVWGVACLCKIGKQRGRHPSQPVLIAQGFDEGCGVLQADEDPPE